MTETSTETTTADPNVTTTEGTTSEGDTEETTIQVTPSDGDGYIWNYTDGTNTNGFYNIDANDWSSAVPVTYNGATLTEAIKMESSSNVSFTTAKNAVFTVVSYSTATAPKIKIDGTSYDISKNGVTTINLTAGTHNITKDTSSTYLYYMQVVEEGSQTSSETTTVTETSSETTTVTESTSQTTTEAPTETTTTAPVSDGLSMNEVNAVMGSDVEVPVIMNGVSDNIATYTITVGYDSSAFTVAGVANGDVLTGDNVEFMYYDNGAGKVVITAINPDNLASAGNKLCILNLTPVKVGASELTLTVDEFVNINGENVTISAKGTLTNTTNSGILGDVNGDGSVNVTDATMVAKYALGAQALTDEQLALADVNNDGNVNVTDAAGIAKMAIGA